MNLCDFEAVDEPQNAKGRRYFCPHCGYVTRPYKYSAEQVRRQCDAKRAPRGAGDVVASAIDTTLKAVGIRKPNCGGCKKRQRWLNKLLPFKGK